MDPFGLLPPIVRHNLEREAMVEQQMRAGKTLERAIVALDPKCDVVFVKPGADPEYGVVPGRWHVRRKNDPPAPHSYFAITTPSGGYREPDSAVIPELQRRDLWNHRDERFFHPTPIDRKGPSREQLLDVAKEETRAAARVSDAGMERKAWGRK